jgi:ribosome-associated toxin RatA of RatAB toxin-antitoxin module
LLDVPYDLLSVVAACGGGGDGFLMRLMNERAPVERSYLVRGSHPRDVYDIVVDFETYPRLFPELKAARVLDRRASVVRVEFRAEVVLAVRYVLDLQCDPHALTVDWTYVEGEIVVASTGGWRFVADPFGTKVDYRVSMLVKAPLPGFIVRKATDALVAASIPGMFASIDREARRRREARGT